MADLNAAINATNAYAKAPSILTIVKDPLRPMHIT